MHGEIILEGHLLCLIDEFAEKEDVTTRTPRTLGGTTVRITVQTDDSDAIVARGARVLMPPSNLRVSRTADHQTTTAFADA